jgi:cob(I)alamin adenosyltransferase
MRIYTKGGDDGTTGLLFGGRVPKDDVRAAVYGTLDEAVSALGLARAAGVGSRVEEIVIRIQRELFVVGAELATAEQNRPKLEPGVSKVTPDMTERAEADIDALTATHPLPEEFVLPGEIASSAARFRSDTAVSTALRADETVAVAASASPPAFHLDPCALGVARLQCHRPGFHPGGVGPLRASAARMENCVARSPCGRSFSSYSRRMMYRWT